MESQDRFIGISLNMIPNLQVGQCILDLLHDSTSENEILVYFKYDRSEGKFILSLLEARDFLPLPLLHAHCCPTRRLRTEFSLAQFITRHVHLCACVIVESYDNRILLTRRSQQMRIFPKAWVNPGGHVEYGESLEEEVLRELKEETGIEGRLSDLKYRMLYESVYPTSLDFGMPSHQHVIVFFSLKLPNRYAFTDMKLQIAEVDLAVWIQSDILREILAGEDPECELEGIQASVKKDTQCKISPLQLIGIAPNEIGEGIGEGHYLALKRYLGI